MKCTAPLLLVAVLGCLVGPVSGQGFFFDDGFNIGCCATPNPTIPPIPNLQCTGKWACFTDCSVTSTQDMIISLGHSPILCDQALIDVSVVPAAGGAGPSFSVTTLGKYARTWLEPAVVMGQNTRQVWRFLINGDATFPGVLGNFSPCPVPPCWFAGHAVHMQGHVDYAREFTANGPIWWVSVSLTHHKGCISHAPWSSHAETGFAAHLRNDYVLVGPGDFAFGDPPEPAGPVVAESVRPAVFDWIPFNYQCLGEGRVVNGNLTTLNDRCFGCTIGTPGPPALWSDQSLSGAVFCNSLSADPFSSVPIPGLTAGGMLCLTIGAWTTPPGTFPQPGMHLYHYFGVMNYTEPCTGRGPFHIMTGVATQTQFPRQLFSAPGQMLPPVRTMLDLQNNLILPLSPVAVLPFPYPGYGSIAAGDLVFNLSLP